MNKWLLFAFTLVLVLAGCSPSSAQRNVTVEKAIHPIVENMDNNSIHIKPITHFDWDKAYLFQPYTTQEMMTEQIGINFKDKSQIDIRDDIYLLVFVHDHKVIQYAEIDRQKSDFIIQDNGYLTPTEDLIGIIRH